MELRFKLDMFGSFVSASVSSPTQPLDVIPLALCLCLNTPWVIPEGPHDESYMTPDDPPRIPQMDPLVIQDWLSNCVLTLGIVWDTCVGGCLGGGAGGGDGGGGGGRGHLHHHLCSMSLA